MWHLVSVLGLIPTVFMATYMNPFRFIWFYGFYVVVEVASSVVNSVVFSIRLYIELDIFLYNEL